MTREDAEGILSEAGRAPEGEFPLLDAAIACSVHDAPGRDPQIAQDLARTGVERLTDRLRM